MKALTCLILAIFSVSAFADFEKRKPVKIDFNQMIESNLVESKKMQKNLSQEGFGERPANHASNKQKVTDLIDAELGWGEAPQISDRRFK